MLSVNTNYSAMVALQNLNYTNTELEVVQNRSTPASRCRAPRTTAPCSPSPQGQRARVTALCCGP